MNLNREIDVYAVGNALVDILTFVEDKFVGSLNFPKGSMNLVDTPIRTRILDALDSDKLERQSGGSAANSVVAIAQSGGKAIFAGKVANDEIGQFFAKDMREDGIGFDIPAASADGEPSGTSIILTTPDAERTMCTHLGVSIELGPDDVLESQIAKCKYSYIEGYLWTGPSTKAAAIKTMELSRKVGTLVSFTFSDPFLVNGFAAEFKEQVLPNCDVIFCNSEEALSYTGADNLDTAASEIGKQVRQAFITDGKSGALVVDNGVVQRVEGFVANAVDTVGAGDSFAGGVLYALSKGFTPAEAARWGNRLASKVVEVQGPRLESIEDDWKREILER